MLLQLHSPVCIAGRVRLVTRRVADDVVIADRTIPNQITYAAVNGLAAWLTGTINRGPQAAPAYPHYMELGTGSGTPAPTDTALFAGVSATSVPCSQLTVISGTPDSPQWVAVWGGASAAAIAGGYTEIGLFDANGGLWAHIAGLTIDISTSTTTAALWTWAFTVD